MGFLDFEIYWMLLDGQAIPTTDMVRYARWRHENPDGRRVALTEFEGVRISTVLLAHDHSFGHGPPVLFETMIFGRAAGDLDQAQERYSSLEEAQAGHAAMVKRVRKILGLREISS